MDLREQAISDIIAREKITLVVDNGLSVFMENILNINLTEQWRRKMYHRHVCSEHSTMQFLKTGNIGIQPLGMELMQ